MSAELVEKTVRQELEEQVGQVWDTSELTTEFEVIGFLAPYVDARRRDTGARGTLEFMASPRFYFGWKASK